MPTRFWPLQIVAQSVYLRGFHTFDVACRCQLLLQNSVKTSVNHVPLAPASLFLSVLKLLAFSPTQLSPGILDWVDYALQLVVERELLDQGELHQDYIRGGPAEVSWTRYTFDDYGFG